MRLSGLRIQGVFSIAKGVHPRFTPFPFPTPHFFFHAAAMPFGPAPQLGLNHVLEVPQAGDLRLGKENVPGLVCPLSSLVFSLT
jgi:hypothetical protein